MNTNEFDYFLPKELIAQTPLSKRDYSRLMVLDENGGIEHKKFYNLVDLLNKGDSLILNNSKVIPARIYGIREDRDTKIEFLLLRQTKEDCWEVMVKPGKKAKVGTKFIFEEGILKAEVLEILEEGNRIVKFFYEGNIYDVLNKIGNMPLPPYITEKLNNPDRYQTVYCNKLGSAAAPTAGLHFTEKLLNKIKEKGVNIEYLTLHVGLGTFKPVKVDDITEHNMHSEHYDLSEKTANVINNTKKNGGRVIAVGTTTCRTLEALADKNTGELKKSQGWTDIFIYPGYKFKVIDSLITNFHLPKSTLIMLVSAFAGYNNIMNAYKEAIKQKYRFFSFGDAMMINTKGR